MSIFGKRALAGLLCLALLCLGAPALGQFFMVGAPSTSGGSAPPAVNNDALIIALSTNDAQLQQINWFTSANQVGDFYGTSSFVYPNAQAFFSGSPGPNATLGVMRIGQVGARARIYGATVCSVVGITTPCESAVGATNNLATLQAISNGSLAWTQDGASLCVNTPGCADATPINLTAATTYAQVLSIINTAIQAAAPTTGALGASLANSSIAPATCPAVLGTDAGGTLTVTSVTSACLYAGGNLQGPNGSSVILGQSSGTSNGAGVYAISTPALQNNLSPYVCNTCVLNYSILTVGTVGATDTIQSGQGLYRTAGLNAGIYGQLTGCVSGVCTYTFPASCVGPACAGTTWVVGSINPNQLNISNTSTMVTQVCQLLVQDNAYTGATINTDRFWVEQQPWCTTARPHHTLSYMTSASSASTDNLAYVIGWAVSSPGVVPNPPYSGPFLSASSESIHADPTAFDATFSSWLNYTYQNVSGMATARNFQMWWDPDEGGQTPTYKNEISAWFAANRPNRTYARVWGSYSYPQASYALNTPYGLPVCTPNVATFTASGPWNPDYCPVHDYLLVGAAGSSGAGGIGASSDGGIGAGGGTTWVQGLTTNSCCVPATVQVGVGGGGQVGNNTQITSWALLTNAGSNVFAYSGNNAVGTTPGAGIACLTNASFIGGTFSSYGCFASGAGASPSATAGAGGSGGTSAASMTHSGFLGFPVGTTSGGGGGAGTNGAGAAPSGTTGGASGANLDLTPPGTGGAGSAVSNVSASPGVAPGGGGGGMSGPASTAPNDSGGAGAPGYAGTLFATLTHGCPGGPGGGGGGGGGNKATSGSQHGGAGGAGGLYGGSPGGGGGVTLAAQTPGPPGAPANGYGCIIGYQDH